MSDFGIGHNGGPMIDQQFGGGWVAIWRSMRTHPVVGFHLHATPCDPNRGALQPALAWIDLIMECRYAAGTVDNNGRVMRLERGQLLGATSWLAKRWNWTPKAVRVWLDKLENQGMISFTIENNPGPYQSQGQSEHGRLNGRSRGRFANVLTICNYNKHQNGDDPEGQVEGPIEGQANGRLTAGSGQVDGRLPYIENARAITKEQGNKETKEDSLGGAAGPIVVHAPDSGTHAEPIAPMVEKPPRAPRGKRLAEDWFLPESWGNRTLATYRVTREQVKIEADRFKNYWLAKSGKDAARVDWEATWRNWCSSTYLAWPRRTEAMEPSKEADDYGAKLDEMRAALIRDLNA